jgi:hypothetical protein
MLHILHFSLQNAVYFIMLLFLVHVLFTFYIQSVLKFKCKTPVPKGQTSSYYCKWGRRWRSWLGHYATSTSRKVAGLIPDGVIGNFLWP